MTTTYAPARPRSRRQARQQAEAVRLEGSSHAAIGFVSGIGLGLLTASPHHGGAAAADAIARDGLFGLVVGGLSLLPDSDHPDASFAHAGGPLSFVVSHVVALLFGGHRQGMHSIPGTALMCAVVAALSLGWPNRWALASLALLLAVCVAAGLRATRAVRHKADAFIVGCAVAGLAVWAVRADLWWLCALGMALHIAADELSGHGCALLWPFTRRRFGGDGHQPAASRKSRGGKSEFQRRQAAAGKTPAARKAPASRPRKRPVPAPAGYTLPVPATEPGTRLAWEAGARCGECLTKAHGECRDRGCKCPHGRHPNRPGAPGPRAARPLPDEPPF